MVNTERSTRERILEVAEQYFGECGYHGTRLHHIAQKVGIQKASLFHYFPSKEQLYRAVMDEGFGETEQTVRGVIEAEGAPMDKVRALVEAYVELVAAHPHRTKILLRHSLGDAPSDLQVPDSNRVVSLVAKLVAEGQQAKVFAPIDPIALVLGVVGMAAFFFTSAPVLAPAWLREPGERPSIDRVKRHIVEVVQRCLATGPALPPEAESPARRDLV